MGTLGKGVWAFDFPEDPVDTPAVADSVPILFEQPCAAAEPGVATAALLVEAGSGSSSSQASPSASGRGSSASGYFSQFNPANMSIDDYCHVPPGLEDWPLDKIEEWVARAKDVLTLVKQRGGGFHFSGTRSKL